MELLVQLPRINCIHRDPRLREPSLQLLNFPHANRERRENEKKHQFNGGYVKENCGTANRTY